MKKTGQVLKEAREKKNLSLHEIGMSLKINPKTLQAMEEGELTKLPAKSFLRGFVKSYAQYLKIDVPQILDLFNSENEPQIEPSTQSTSPATPLEPSHAETSISEKKTKPIPPSAKKLYSAASQNTDSFFKNKLLLTTSAAVLVILIVITAKLVDKYQKERVVDHTQVQKIQLEETLPSKKEGGVEERPTTATAAAPLISENLISPAPQLVPEKKVEVKSSKVEQKPDSKLSKPEQKIETSSTGRPIQPTETQLPAQTTAPPPAPPAAAKPPGSTVPEKPTEVIVEALNKVIIRYNLGDGKINTLELAPEELHTFKSKTVVELDISDGGSVSLIVNGRERGVPGSAGKPVKLVYPKQ